MGRPNTTTCLFGLEGLFVSPRKYYYLEILIFRKTNLTRYRNSEETKEGVDPSGVAKLLPPSSNVSHSRVFKTYYNRVEKTLLPLIIKH